MATLKKSIRALAGGAIVLAVCATANAQNNSIGGSRGSASDPRAMDHWAPASVSAARAASMPTSVLVLAAVAWRAPVRCLKKRQHRRWPEQPGQFQHQALPSVAHAGWQPTAVPPWLALTGWSNSITTLSLGGTGRGKWRGFRHSRRHCSPEHP